MLNEIKKDFEWGKKVGGRGYNNLDDEQVEWLFKQAEIVKTIEEEIKGKWSTEMVSVNRLYNILKY